MKMITRRFGEREFCYISSNRFHDLPPRITWKFIEAVPYVDGLGCIGTPYGHPRFEAFTRYTR